MKTAPAGGVAPLVAVALAMLMLPAPSFAQARGELLYSNHCGACHTAQMHWRAARAATDWSSLVAQVRRWQGVASLGWSDADVDDVARYLNENIYHFEHTIGRVSSSQSMEASR